MYFQVVANNSLTHPSRKSGHFSHIFSRNKKEPINTCCQQCWPLFAIIKNNTGLLFVGSVFFRPKICHKNVFNILCLEILSKSYHIWCCLDITIIYINFIYMDWYYGIELIVLITIFPKPSLWSIAQGFFLNLGLKD